VIGGEGMGDGMVVGGFGLCVVGRDLDLDFESKLFLLIVRGDFIPYVLSLAYLSSISFEVMIFVFKFMDFFF